VLQKLRARSATEVVTMAARLRGPLPICRLSVPGVEALLVDMGPSPETILASRLTSAERQVAALVLDGLSTAEIAELRRSAYRTVANQLASIYEKLGVGSRVELGAYVAKSSASAS
jgi:DNA-binding CsgD family transcriptional regulator